MQHSALDRIEQAVAAAERNTSCEFIVILAPASSRYEGRALKAAAAVGGLVFVAQDLLHWLWLGALADGLFLLIEALVVAALALLALRRVPALRRMLLPRWLMRDAVDMTSAALFTKENVSLTRERNGCLLFVSVLEGEARVMPDIGMERALDGARLGEIRAGLANAAGDPVEALCAALQRLGGCCREKFPRAADDVNELPDRPQIWLP